MSHQQHELIIWDPVFSIGCKGTAIVMECVLSTKGLRTLQARGLVLVGAVGVCGGASNVAVYAVSSMSRYRCLRDDQLV